MNACLERIQENFAHHGASVEVIAHPSAFTSQETAAAEHVSGHDLVKAVIVMIDGQPAALGLQASRQVDFDALRRALGAGETRLAREEEFAALFPDCEVGAMPPLGGPSGLPLYLDEGVLGRAAVVFDAGTHEVAVRVALDDYLRVAAPRLLRFACPPAGEQERQRRRRRRPAWRRGAALLGAAALVGGLGRLAVALARRRPGGASLLAGLVLGAAGAALLDPGSGRRRRALVRDRGRRYGRQLGRAWSGGSRRAVDRGRGLVARLRRRQRDQSRSA